MHQCPICMGDPQEQADCQACSGRGEVTGVPYCERKWDEIVPGLFVGGTAYAPDGGRFGSEVVVDFEFDLVVSLADSEGYGPAEGVQHIRYRIRDDLGKPLPDEHHERLDQLAYDISWSVAHRRKVLVRCQAGINRSAMVAGLAMVNLGYTPEQIFQLLRTRRTKFALFNSNFRDHLRQRYEAHAEELAGQQFVPLPGGDR